MTLAIYFSSTLLELEVDEIILLSRNLARNHHDNIKNKEYRKLLIPLTKYPYFYKQ